MLSLYTIEILCEFFNVTKEYLLKEDEPLQIIENVQKRSLKKLIFVLALLVPLILYFVVSIIFFTCDKINDRHTMQYNTFGILYIWLTPYKIASYTAAYLNPSSLIKEEA